MAGILERYYKQVAYDAFNQTEAAIENKYATELDMKYFVYSGGLIATSRAFCRKRAGKVFSIEETAKWKCDPDLIKPKGKKCDDSYNPLIDRGRYNCRHTIQYISDELACKMRPELCKKERIINRVDPIEPYDKPPDFNRKYNIDQKNVDYTRSISDEIKDNFKEEYKTLWNYSRDDFSIINDAMRGNIPIDNKIKNKILNLNKILNKLPNYEGDVFRSMSSFIKTDFENWINKLSTGNIFGDKAFLSTTNEMELAGEFALKGDFKIFMRIKSKSGKYIAPFSASPREGEVLFRQNAKFIIKSNELKGNKLYIELEEIII